MCRTAEGKAHAHSEQASSSSIYPKNMLRLMRSVATNAVAGMPYRSVSAAHSSGEINISPVAATL
jgi:hypothetical protein